MGAALGGEGDAGRGADQERLAARVDAELPGLQGAVDERVVHDADGEQGLAPAAPGGAEFAEEADEVGLGDAEFHVLAGGVLAPVQDRLGVVGEPVDALGRGPDADLVEPAAEVGGGGDVGADGDDAGGGLGGAAAEVEQGAAERLLGGAGAAGGAAEVGGDRRRGDPPDGRAAQFLGALGAEPGGGAVGQRAPGVVRVGAGAGGEVGELVAGEERGVVLRVALAVQAAPLTV